jgi:hypothetical protein
MVSEKLDYLGQDVGEGVPVVVVGFSLGAGGGSSGEDTAVSICGKQVF